MLNWPPVSAQTLRNHQDEKTARRILESCIDQLTTAAIGDSEWIEACQLLGQIDPAFVPMQIEALTDDRYQVCRALAVDLSRIGPSIFYDVIPDIDRRLAFAGPGRIRAKMPVPVKRQDVAVLLGVLGDFLDIAQPLNVASPDGRLLAGLLIVVRRVDVDVVAGQDLFLVGRFQDLKTCRASGDRFGFTGSPADAVAKHRVSRASRLPT